VATLDPKDEERLKKEYGDIFGGLLSSTAPVASSEYMTAGMWDDYIRPGMKWVGDKLDLVSPEVRKFVEESKEEGVRLEKDRETLKKLMDDYIASPIMEEEMRKEIPFKKIGFMEDLIAAEVADESARPGRAYIESLDKDPSAMIRAIGDMEKDPTAIGILPTEEGAFPYGTEDLGRPALPTIEASFETPVALPTLDERLDVPESEMDLRMKGLESLERPSHWMSAEDIIASSVSERAKGADPIGTRGKLAEMERRDEEYDKLFVDPVLPELHDRTLIGTAWDALTKELPFTLESGGTGPRGPMIDGLDYFEGYPGMTPAATPEAISTSPVSLPSSLTSMIDADMASGMFPEVAAVSLPSGLEPGGMADPAPEEPGFFDKILGAAVDYGTDVLDVRTKEVKAVIDAISALPTDLKGLIDTFYDKPIASLTPRTGYRESELGRILAPDPYKGLTAPDPFPMRSPFSGASTMPADPTWAASGPLGYSSITGTLYPTASEIETAETASRVDDFSSMPAPAPAPVSVPAALVAEVLAPSIDLGKLSGRELDDYLSSAAADAVMSRGIYGIGPGESALSAEYGGLGYGGGPSGDMWT